jgi:hypothetical protein
MSNRFPEPTLPLEKIAILACLNHHIFSKGNQVKCQKTIGLKTGQLYELKAGNPKPLTAEIGRLCWKA